MSVGFQRIELELESDSGGVGGATGRPHWAQSEKHFLTVNTV